MLQSLLLLALLSHIKIQYDSKISANNVFKKTNALQYQAKFKNIKNISFNVELISDSHLRFQIVVLYYKNKSYFEVALLFILYSQSNAKTTK